MCYEEVARNTFDSQGCPMDPIKAITDFFMQLVRSRVNQASSQARSQMNSAQAKAKMKAAKAFNDAVDGGVDKVRGAGKAKVDPQADQRPKS